MSFTCQSSLGPAAGHCLSSPLSFEIPLRSGPRHWGQSAVWAGGVTAEKHNESAANMISDLKAISSPSVWCAGASEYWYAEFQGMFALPP